MYHTCVYRICHVEIYLSLYGCVAISQLSWTRRFGNTQPFRRPIFYCSGRNVRFQTTLHNNLSIYSLWFWVEIIQGSQSKFIFNTSYLVGASIWKCYRDIWKRKNLCGVAEQFYWFIRSRFNTNFWQSL